ncbi:MAG: DUF1217 domain-containing protein [Amphiplicatus sp.]
MTYFQPAIPIGGYGGWRVLQKTAPQQRAAFEKSPSLNRHIEYFRENIKNALTAEDLVKDRRLLVVALGAFGLGDEINKRAFIQRALEGGTDDPSAFANRLSDLRWRKMSKSFGYGNIAGANVGLSAFREDIIARYKSLEFERAVGEVDEDMRVAMNFKREIAEIAAGENVDRTGWLQVMGRLPLRTLLSTALGLPKSVAQLDIDKQREIFADKALKVFGEKSVAQFSDPEKIEEATRRFFLFRQMESGPSASTPGAAAVMLLQNSALGGSAIANILASQS